MRATFSLTVMALERSPREIVVDEIFGALGLLSLISSAWMIDSTLDKHKLGYKRRFALIGHGYFLFCLVVAAMSLGIWLLYYVRNTVPKEITLGNSLIPLILMVLLFVCVLSKLMTYDDKHILTALMPILVFLLILIVVTDFHGLKERSEKVVEPILLQQAPSPLQQAAWVFAILGVIVAAGSLVVSAIANRQSARVNEENANAERARFWLDLRTIFASHDKVHVDLKPGSRWGAIRTVLEEHDAYKKYRLAPTEEGPSTPQEWAPVEAYMGLFELCEMMLKNNLIDEDTFESLYKYRLTNIMWNKVIVNQKIIGRASGWRRFNDLLDRFAIVKQVREPQEEFIGPKDVEL